VSSSLREQNDNGMTFLCWLTLIEHNTQIDKGIGLIRS
jgi:hypothetical protein